MPSTSIGLFFRSSRTECRQTMHSRPTSTYVRIHLICSKHSFRLENLRLSFRNKKSNAPNFERTSFPERSHLYPLYDRKIRMTTRRSHSDRCKFFARTPNTSVRYIFHHISLNYSETVSNRIMAIVFHIYATIYEMVARKKK